MHQSLWWPCDYREQEKTIEVDDRLKGPVGFCGVRNGRLAGFVGVLDAPTKTLSGTQKVGGIWTVATNPSFANQGVFKALMNRAHQYFKDQDYPFSFLFTIRTLIAYNMYNKLGYEEVEWFVKIPSAYKLGRGKGFDERSEEKSLNWDKIYELYRNSVKGKTGFVIRQDNFKEVLKTWKKIGESKCIQVDDGYTLLSEDDGVVKIREMIAESETSYDEMFNTVEERAKKAMIDNMVVNKKLEDKYKSRKFLIQEDNYGILVAKKLSDLTLKDVYGEKFQILDLDIF